MTTRFLPAHCAVTVMIVFLSFAPLARAKESAKREVQLAADFQLPQLPQIPGLAGPAADWRQWDSFFTFIVKRFGQD
ncbi:MAG: hypothetical protein ACM37Z_12175, partial [Deltaproteobacteria bacterium]